MGLAIDRERKWLYVADTDNGRIQKLDLDGRLLLTWGEPGTRKEQLYRPKGVAVTPEGDLYVVDTNNHRVKKYTSDGLFVGSFGRNGMEDGELWFPFGVAVDGEGRLWVTDSENGRIQAFRENPHVARLYASRSQ
jgi:sugar lactone lactonase YvrE